MPVPNQLYCCFSTDSWFGWEEGIVRSPWIPLVSEGEEVWSFKCRWGAQVRDVVLTCNFFSGSLLGIFVQQLEKKKNCILIGVGSKSFEYCCAAVRRTNVAFCNILYFKSALLLLLMEWWIGWDEGTVRSPLILFVSKLEDVYASKCRRGP